ncbi:MAG: M15 family metallopeptidase [Alphaproteobacteria bacterium]
MFDDSKLSEPELIFEIENPVQLVEINGQNNILFNSKYTNERRVRKYIYELLLKAKGHLPKNYNFVIYEGYRTLESQKKLWDEVVLKKTNEYPNLDPNSEEFISICNVFVANPHRQGSGHQSGAAVDVALIDDEGIEYDMGGIVRGFGEEATFDAQNISSEARKNRNILKNALEKVGLVNYPSEWWHYSFGDRLWARLTESKIAIFSNLKF